MPHRQHQPQNAVTAMRRRNYPPQKRLAIYGPHGLPAKLGASRLSKALTAQGAAGFAAAYAAPRLTRRDTALTLQLTLVC